MLRRILAVIVAALVGSLVIWAVQSIGHLVYPLPEGLDTGDLEQMKAYVASLPLGAFGFILAAYVLGSFAAGWTAVSIAKTMGPALAAGVVFTLAGIANVLLIPHPLWFAVATLLCYVPCALLGGRLSPGRPRG